MAWSGSEGEFQDFVDKYGLTFPQINDERGDIYARFGIAYQPALVIVSPLSRLRFILTFGSEPSALSPKAKA